MHVEIIGALSRIVRQIGHVFICPVEIGYKNRVRILASISTLPVQSFFRLYHLGVIISKFSADTDSCGYLENIKRDFPRRARYDMARRRGFAAVVLFELDLTC